MEGGGKAAKEDLILYLNEVKGPLCAWCYDEPVPFKEINKKNTNSWCFRTDGVHQTSIHFYNSFLSGLGSAGSKWDCQNVNICDAGSR